VLSHSGLAKGGEEEMKCISIIPPSARVEKADCGEIGWRFCVGDSDLTTQNICAILSNKERFRRKHKWTMAGRKL
jgi:hypothetical protein